MNTARYPRNLDDIYAKYAAETENESAVTWARRLLAPAMTAALAWPAKPLGRALARPIHKETEMVNTARNAKLPSPAATKILAKQDRLIAKAQKLRPDLRFARVRPAGPAYSSFTRTVYAPTTKPEYMAHELGHSLNDATWRHLFGSKRGVKYPTLLRSILPFFGNTTGLALMMSDNKDVRDAAPLVTTAASVPKLTGELLASLRGMKNYRKGLGVKGRIKPYGSLARALSTYLVGAAAWPLAMWATNRLNDRLYKNNP